MFEGYVVNGPHKGRWVRHNAPVVKLRVPQPLPPVHRWDDGAPVKDVTFATATYQFDPPTQTWYATI